MQERLEAPASHLSRCQQPRHSPGTARGPAGLAARRTSNEVEGICVGVAAPRFRGDFNRLRYPVLKSAAPVDDASLQIQEIQGRMDHPRGLAVSVIQSSESMARTENAGEASEGPEQTARSRSSRADASFASPVLGTYARRSARPLPEPSRLDSPAAQLVSNIRAHVDVADELDVRGQSACQDQVSSRIKIQGPDKRTGPLAR
ncbi:hypothetical protein TRIATDRAFT_320896 [Trichoderma atroviride IMI 206040]|uniref:Uncharacterized protein n=1 Tax=Hypocrea atroviridis (strain ATCC 20476 / IMI 206040) TaxID=452589 RepID=G9P616_HYPAI|nr:uncharacterized protein TRIATDRAFT_320896 [Trichoderma atroviride IMI 206040]EHK40570.1 hypothetical protein TRIATDRAFT_320896 [Trichoderma atroviride IMI 206040]